MTLNLLVFWYCENTFICNISKHVGSERCTRWLSTWYIEAINYLHRIYEDHFYETVVDAFDCHVTSVGSPLIGSGSSGETFPVCWQQVHLACSLHISLIFCLMFSEFEPPSVCSAYVQMQPESLRQVLKVFYSLGLKKSTLYCHFFLEPVPLSLLPHFIFLGSLSYTPPACFRLYFWVNAN